SMHAQLRRSGGGVLIDVLSWSRRLAVPLAVTEAQYVAGALSMRVTHISAPFRAVYRQKARMRTLRVVAKSSFRSGSLPRPRSQGPS
ncbi:MAG: hypothetical protein J2O49_11230, partial [Sciscionella sp.]|nr:hypothetical protein [Sciscionella sp.]